MSNGSVTRLYGGFRGVDFRGDEINLIRSPDSVNMWKDYKETESIRTRPALEQRCDFDEKVYGIFFFDSINGRECIVHSGTRLYSVINGQKKLIFSGANLKMSNAFTYNSLFYYLDGKNYLQYDGVSCSEVVGYVPTTTIGRTAEGGGEPHEFVNLISKRRINTFVGDGKSVEYHLDAEGVSEAFKPIVKVDGEKISGYTVDYPAGKITFSEALPAPLTEGQDNVSIEFEVETKDKEKIFGCSMLQVFDNRVFLSGNDSFPNTIWHSSLNDPTYFSDDDYYNEGLDTAKVTGLVAGHNGLWVLREPSQSKTSIFYHVPTPDAEYGKIYPSTHSNIDIGCVGGAVNFNDDIVFFSERGMEGINGNITTEQAVAHRSSLVDRKLTSEQGYKDMVLAEWQGYLLVFVGSHAYVADSRATFKNEGHAEYEWFYWELDKEVTCAVQSDGVLYVGSTDGIYSFTDYQKPIFSYWVTAKDKFKYPHMQKTTNKRGCVVEALGDMSIYAKTDKTEFELISSYKNITDCVVPKIKCKKFKDMQLKFQSNTRFSLETVTLEAFVGGYVKR